MKKFIYILVFACVSALTITSCTDEEEVAPTTELNGGGAGSSDKGF